MLCALIMAGGIGSRFWPQSTEEKPKQFLNLLGDRTMIQLTYDRMNRLIPSERIFIITNKCYVDLVKEQLPNIENRNIICEPYSKNTAPCILLSSLYIKKIYPDANIVCVSSDSYIGKENEFLDKIKLANNFVEKDNQAIVTLGITPTRPEVGYGYIKYEQNTSIPNKVIEFVEKPNLETAKKYLASHEYLWNAGMYIYNNLHMLEEIKKYLPVEYQLLKDLPSINDDNYDEYLNNNYQQCQKISIDYAVMEKSPNVYAIPSSIDWDDVGSWHALERYIKKDNDGNISKGDIKVIDSHDNIIYGNDKKIVLLNADNLFCIDSDNLIIVGRREDLDKVHLLKDQINENL